MIAWLTWRIGALIVAGLLAAVSGAAIYDGIDKRAQIRTLEGVLDKTAAALKLEQTNLGTCHANYRLVELALDRQGQDIRGLAEASKAAGDRAAAAALRGAVEAKAAREASQRVLARPLPTPDLACMEAARLLRDGM